MVLSGVRVARSLVFYVDRCLSFCPFSFGRYIIFKLMTYDNFCVTKIKYIMSTVQDEGVLYKNSANPVVFEGWHVIHTCMTLSFH